MSSLALRRWQRSACRGNPVRLQRDEYCLLELMRLHSYDLVVLNAIVSPVCWQTKSQPSGAKAICRRTLDTVDNLHDIKASTNIHTVTGCYSGIGVVCEVPKLVLPWLRRSEWPVTRRSA